jgi:flagellar motor switch protein FliM
MEIMPTAAEANLAKESSRTLAKALPKRKSSVTIKVGEDNSFTDVIVPMSALKLLLNLLGEMAQGKGPSKQAAQQEAAKEALGSSGL